MRMPGTRTARTTSHGTRTLTFDHVPAALSASDVTSVELEFADLYFHANDRVMTPHIAMHKMWEPEEGAFFRTLLEPGMSVLDCGANVGYFSVMFSKFVGDDGHVYAVEPEPRNLGLLRANLWRNGCANVDVLPVAAYSSNGFLPFGSNEENRGDHQTLPRATGDLLVPSARLDDLLADAHIDVAKIDTQGVDHEVVASLRSKLGRRGIHTLLVEFWLEGMEDRDVDVRQVLRDYRSLDLELHLLDDDGNSELADDDAILARCDAWEGRYVNLVLRAR